VSFFLRWHRWLESDDGGAQSRCHPSIERMRCRVRHQPRRLVRTSATRVDRVRTTDQDPRGGVQTLAGSRLPVRRSPLLQSRRQSSGPSIWVATTSRDYRSRLPRHRRSHVFDCGQLRRKTPKLRAWQSHHGGQSSRSAANPAAKLLCVCHGMLKLLHSDKSGVAKQDIYTCSCRSRLS